MARLTASVLFLLAAPALAGAQSFETVGARALGMGGAHVAVAEDPTAIWWNPAGLATGRPLVSAAIEFARYETRQPDLFGTPPPGRRTSFFVGLGSLPLGLSYVRTRETWFAQGPADEAVVRDLATHQLGATVLQSLTDTIVVGATLKYVRAGAKAGPVEPGLALDEAADSLAAEGGSAFDADVGISAVAGLLRLGLTFRNVMSPAFEAPDGTSLELPWQARAGVAFLPNDTLTFAADLDLRSIRAGADLRRNLALGVEQRIGGRAGFTRFAVRAGARFDTVGEIRPLGTVGGSYAVRNGVWVDVWAAAGGNDADRGWGVAGRIVY